MAEAAEEARVSRTTAYRYLPSQEALLLEVAELAPAVAPVEAMLAALPADGGGSAGDAGERLLHLVDAFNPVVFADGVPMRTALRAYPDTWTPSVIGRRVVNAGSSVSRILLLFVVCAAAAT